MNPSVQIYVLRDPRKRGKEAIRYVGKTRLSLEGRLQIHVNETRSCGVGTHKRNWLLGLIKLGLKPSIKPLEFVAGEDWQSREIYWIAKLKALGCPLTNSAAGGWGLSICDEALREKLRQSALARAPMSQETRRKIAAANTGKKHSLESIAKMSAVQLAKKRVLSPEFKKRLSDLGKRQRKPTVEERARQVAAQLGKVVSAETRKKLSDALRGRKKSPEVVAKMRAAQQARRAKARAGVAGD